MQQQAEIVARNKNRECNFKLAVGIALAMATGAMVAIGVFVLILVYQFSTGQLRAADPLNLTFYLLAPALGLLVALAGSVAALRKWLRSRSSGQ